MLVRCRLDSPTAAGDLLFTVAASASRFGACQAWADLLPGLSSWNLHPTKKVSVPPFQVRAEDSGVRHLVSCGTRIPAWCEGLLTSYPNFKPLKPLSLRHEAKYPGYREWAKPTLWIQRWKTESRPSVSSFMLGKPDMQAGDHHSQRYR